MSNAIVSNVYRYVIDDVINQVRGEFEDMGIDEAVLRELQRSWETKVARSRVANFGFNGDEYYEEEGEQSNTNTQNDGSYSEVKIESYSQNPPAAANLAAIGNATVRTQTQPNINKNNNGNNLPTATPSNVNNNSNVLRPPQTPQQQQQQQQSPPTLPSLTSSSQQQSPYHLPSTTLPHLPPVNGGNQYHQMLHPTTLSSSSPNHHHLQQQPSLPDLHLPGGANRPNLPQNDGLNDTMSTEEIDAQLEKTIINIHQQQTSQHNQDEIIFSATNFSGERLSLEQLPDHIKLLMKDARERAIKAGAIQSKSRIGQLDGDNDNSAPPATPANNNDQNINNDDDINSDLDDSDDADADAEGGEEIEHIILCLYDKVTRTKNKWKCVLKDGIMLVNGRDYLFHRANGDFEW